MFGPMRRVLVILVCLLGGCRGEEPEAEAVPTVEVGEIEPLGYDRSERTTVILPAGGEALRPTATLPTGEKLLALRAQRGLVRVTAADDAGRERTVIEAESDGGGFLVLDRGSGVVLGSRELTGGRLDPEAEYRVYLLPPGGAAGNTSERRSYRPAVEPPPPQTPLDRFGRPGTTRPATRPDSADAAD